MGVFDKAILKVENEVLDLPFDEAMAFETAAGRAILTGPEIAAGVGRFVSGDGRHGASRTS